MGLGWRDMAYDVGLAGLGCTEGHGVRRYTEFAEHHPREEAADQSPYGAHILAESYESVY